jgi:hypothetical protein
MALVLRQIADNGYPASDQTLATLLRHEGAHADAADMVAEALEADDVQRVYKVELFNADPATGRAQLQAMHCYRLVNPKENETRLTYAAVSAYPVDMHSTSPPDVSAIRGLGFPTDE